MDVKEAVANAKRYVGELFGEEGITNLGLEEVEFDEGAGEWRVTVGFSRPWDAVRGVAALAQQFPQRSYKVVSLSENTGTSFRSETAMLWHLDHHFGCKPAGSMDRRRGVA